MEYFDEDDIDELNKIMNKDTILKFYADWCKNCNLVNESILKYCNNNNCKCICINIDNNTSISEHYNIEKLPTIILNKDEKIFGVSSINEKLNKLENIILTEDF